MRVWHWTLIVAIPSAVGCGDSSGTGGDPSTGGAAAGGAGEGGSTGIQDVYALSEAAAFPEGMAFDPDSQSFFVGSLGHGSITRVDAATGAESVFYPPDSGEPYATLGMEVDVATRTLWVCAIDRDTYAGRVWTFDADSGRRSAELVLEDTFAGGSCNDIALDASGVAYVTDRENPNIYRIDPAVGLAEIWATDPLLEPGLVGLNGIAVSPDGASVLANTYLPAKLFRIAMSDPTDVVEVTLSGDEFAGTEAGAGADGSQFLGDDLYIPFGSETLKLTGNADWTTATVTTATQGAGLTAVVVANGELYASNGQSFKFLVGQEPDPFTIQRLDASLWAP